MSEHTLSTRPGRVNGYGWESTDVWCSKCSKVVATTDEREFPVVAILAAQEVHEAVMANQSVRFTP